jgi:hypothetical protein
MKKAILFAILLILSATSFSQPITPVQPLTSEDYLRKSKTQKTVGWIMLGGGVAITTIGLLIADKQINDDPYGFIISDKGSGTAILTIIGIGTALGSIPLFIAAGKNRRRAAAAVSFKMESATTIYQWAVSNNRYPAVVVQFRL